MRTQVPVAIAFIAGALMVIQFFVPTHQSTAFETIMLMAARVIGAFALIVGIGSLVKVNSDKLRRRSEGWPFAIVILSGLTAMAVLGILGSESADARPLQLKLDAIFQWLYMNVQVPMDATIFSLLAFFIASAAYRTFRARTFEAGLLLVAALIVMVGRIPLGIEFGRMIQEGLGIAGPAGAADWNWLDALVEWILNFPNTAAQRAIMFGAALAAVAQALRIIVGIERPYMSGS